MFRLAFHKREPVSPQRCLPRGLRRCALVAAAVATLLGSGTAFASRHNIEVTINIFPALGMSFLSDLYFGTIVPSATTPSTVRVDLSGANSSTCGVGLSCLEAGDRAAMNIVGTPGYRIDIAGPVSSTLSDGQGNTMLVDDYRIGQGGNGNALGRAFRLDANGGQDLYVGATLHVGAGQPVGAYSGTFAITASYE